MREISLQFGYFQGSRATALLCPPVKNEAPLLSSLALICGKVQTLLGKELPSQLLYF